MTAFPWKISGKGVLRSGVVEAPSDREALAQVLGGKVGFSPVPTESYSITVGPLTTSAYGDEFERVAGSTKIDETQLDKDRGFLFDDPVRKQLEGKAIEAGKGRLIESLLADAMKRAEQPCPANRGGHHSFNSDRFIKKGDAGTFKHGQCDCGAITPTPVSTEPIKVPVPPYPMSDKLKREFERLDAIGKAAARDEAERLLKEMIARTPVDPGRLADEFVRGLHGMDRIKDRIIRLASMKTKGTWTPDQARHVTRREDIACVDVTFADSQCQETIRLTDMEIHLARF